MLGETRLSEDKAKKAMIDAARLADELRAEQEAAQGMERNRRGLEYQVKDMQTKLDEAEQLAMKGGRKVVQRLEQRIRELEGQLDEEQRRLVDGQKNQRRIDRRIKELTFQQEEDHKNHERMQELVDKFQNKVKKSKYNLFSLIVDSTYVTFMTIKFFYNHQVKTYKKQIEEAEEIAALNLAKFRKVQADLEEADERADLNEQLVAKFKARGRSGTPGF